MNCIRVMIIMTRCSIMVAILSFLWHAFVSLKSISRLTTLLQALLLIESNFVSNIDLLQIRRIAVGFGACTDIIIQAPIFLNYTDYKTPDAKYEPHRHHTTTLENDQQFLQAFGYYFQNGAAAERVTSEGCLFNDLVAKAKTTYRKNLTWAVGGNAPIMATRFLKEGSIVLLAADMSKRLRLFLPDELLIVGEYVAQDDIHLVLEYKTGDRWGPYTAPRANRFILHNDVQNPLLKAVDRFGNMITQFAPHLLVICGLQVMDDNAFALPLRKPRLMHINRQMNVLPYETQTHFEMSSFVELEMIELLNELVFPYMDSFGMNEQELENLLQVLHYGRIAHATEGNPCVMQTLDKMRNIFQIFTEIYYSSEIASRAMRQRLVSRLHLHTLSHQIILTVKGSKWKNSKVAVVKAALAAYRYVCQSKKIYVDTNSVIMDNKCDTIMNEQKIDLRDGVNCWDEYIEFGRPSIIHNKTVMSKIDVEICVAPVLICRVAKKTAGAGDNIAAVALSVQI